MSEKELAQELIDLAVEAGANSLVVQLLQRALDIGETFRAIVGALELLRYSDLTPQLRGELNRYAADLTECQREQLGLPPTTRS
jgi:hypothetical protein